MAGRNYSQALQNTNPNNNPFQSINTSTVSSVGDQTTTEISSQSDIHSPFFLHSGDHPGLVLVSHILTGPNYNTWNRAMKTALNAKNKLGFVDGTLRQPASGDANANIWSRCNSMVISWLLNAVSKEIADSLLYLDSAEEIWNDLHDRFRQSNVPRIYQLKQQLMNLSQGSLDINTYFTRLKILWDELKNYQPLPIYSCGGMKAWTDHLEQEHVIQFLMGLNDSYTGIRAQILMVDPLSNVSKVFNLVVQEERQRTIGSGGSVSGDSLAFSVTTSANETPMNAVAAATVNGGGRGRRERPVCSHCGLTGHRVDKCYRLHGFPPGYQLKSRTIQSPLGQQNHRSRPVTSPAQREYSKNYSSVTAATVTSPASSTGGTFSTDQMQQMIAFLSSQLRSQASDQSELCTASSSTPIVSNLCGPGPGIDDWEG